MTTHHPSHFAEIWFRKQENLSEELSASIQKVMSKSIMETITFADTPTAI